MIILKVSKFQGFRISLEDTFFEKPQTTNLKLTPTPADLGLTSMVKR